MKLKRLVLSMLAFMMISGFMGCGKNYDNATAAITAFIIGVEQHDMGKLWGMLGPEAQAYYNDLGEKQRRSGRGALEREINNIKSFKSLRGDYKLKEDKDNPGTVKIIIIGGSEFPVLTVNEEGGYKIKDGQSVRNLLIGITLEKNQKEGY